MFESRNHYQLYETNNSLYGCKGLIAHEYFNTSLTLAVFLSPYTVNKGVYSTTVPSQSQEWLDSLYRLSLASVYEVTIVYWNHYYD